MEGSRAEQAIRRIEAALGRIEAATDALPSSLTGAISETGQDAVLRSQVTATLRELDQLIERLER